MATTLQRVGPVAATTGNGAVIFTNGPTPAIVYSINATNTAGAAASAQAYFSPSGTAAGAQTAAQQVGANGAIPANTAAGNAVNLLPARMILNPNEVIIVAASAATVTVEANLVLIDPDEGVGVMAQL